MCLRLTSPRKSLVCILSIYAAIQPAIVCHGQEANVANPTLKRAIASWSPRVHNSAIEAIVTRTFYEPQPIDGYTSGVESRVERTLVSEMAVNTDGIRESVVDNRRVGSSMTQSLLNFSDPGFLKQAVYHYAENEFVATSYDSSTKRAKVRASVGGQHKNRLSILTNPALGAQDRRFLARSEPTSLTDFEDAMVTSESNGVDRDGHPVVWIEGYYNGAVPERSFKMAVSPDMNYVVTELRQFGSQQRPLAEFVYKNHRRIAIDDEVIWLPESTASKIYRYDDNEGSTVQESKTDILKMAVVSAGEEYFTLSTPPDAQVYNADLGINPAVSPLQLANSIKRDIEQRLESNYRDSTSQVLDSRIRTSEEILHSARAAYEGQTAASINLPTAKLELPQSDFNRLIGLVAALGLLLIFASGWIGFRTIRKRKEVSAQEKLP